MDSVQVAGVESVEYEQPKIVDYGSLLELTKSGGSVAPADVPHGLPNSAFPLS